MLDPSRLARRVAELRRARSLKREQLAVKAGVSSSTVDNLEQGRALPRIETLDRIADALDVELSTLLEDDEPAACNRPALACAA